MDITREILLAIFAYVGLCSLYNIVGFLLAFYKGIYLPFIKIKCKTIWKCMFYDVLEEE